MYSSQIIAKVKTFIKDKNDKEFHKFIFSEECIDKKQAEEIF
jgi:hypothetical protein